MKCFLLTLFSLMAIQTVFSQVTFPNTNLDGPVRPKILQRVEVQQDSVLTKMLDWHMQQNKMENGIQGFRVEIFFSSAYDAKSKALKKKVDFLSVYPDHSVHVKYDAPNFRVRVGDFRTKNEALKIYKEIKDEYPVAFIVADEIDFPLLKQNQNERPN